MVTGTMTSQSLVQRVNYLIMMKRLKRFGKNSIHLMSLLQPTNFKSYEELKTRLDAVLSGTVSVGNVEEEMVDEPIAQPKVDTKEVKSDSDEDTMDYFQKLASEG